MNRQISKLIFWAFVSLFACSCEKAVITTTTLTSTTDSIPPTSSILSAYANSGIQTITVDAQNNIWFGTYEGLLKFDGLNWTSFMESGYDLYSGYVLAIAIDSLDIKWMGTGRGVFKFDGTNWTSYTSSNSGVPKDYSSCVVIDAEGNKWFGFGWSGGGVSKFDGTNWNLQYVQWFGW
jgi:ligand-binding sensor domain-containing protein